MLTNVDVCRFRFGLPLKFFTYATITLLTALPTQVSASEIVINDCNGVTRAQHEIIKESDRFDVTIKLQGNTPLPSKALLVSEDSSIEKEIVNGEIAFSGLGEGTYEFCDSEKMAKIARADFEPATETNIASAGGIGLGAAAVSGVALALGSSGGSSGEATAVESNNLIGSLPSSNVAPSARPNKPATIRPTSQSDRDCLNGAKIQPLSPFE